MIYQAPFFQYNNLTILRMNLFFMDNTRRNFN